MSSSLVIRPIIFCDSCLSSFNPGMRLIHTDSLALEEFLTDDIPKYAILSHTWGTGEVSFADFNKRHASEKPGFSKILMACAQARQDRLSYVWIDTCCIDKSSSAELSEAINSMYRWYEEAQICYVYLSDFNVIDVTSTDMLTAFSECRWFTRGWTLQELIAPSVVIFFDNTWKRYGTKMSLISPLEQITGIDSTVLGHTRFLSHISVARKMSWAARRQTSRSEDIAYCLLGIFDVNMPLIYGEGKKAFTRLQEEILKNSDDQSIFAWRATEDSDQGLLASSPSYFASSRDFVPFRDWGTSTPHSMTNKGLRISVHLADAEKYIDGAILQNKNLYAVAALNCWIDGNATEKIGIYLRCLEGDQYCRTGCASLLEVRNTETKPTTIFVRKNILLVQDHDVIRNGHKFVVQVEGFPEDFEQAWIEGFPKRRWDDKERAFWGSMHECTPGIILLDFDGDPMFVHMAYDVEDEDTWCVIKAARQGEVLSQVYSEIKSQSREALDFMGWSDTVQGKTHTFSVGIEQEFAGIASYNVTVKREPRGNTLR